MYTKLLLVCVANIWLMIKKNENKFHNGMEGKKAERKGKCGLREILLKKKLDVNSKSLSTVFFI